jgi:hypothetical protein
MNRPAKFLPNVSNKYVKKPRYNSLESRFKKLVDVVEVDDLLRCLEEGRYDTFNHFFGIIWDLKEINGRVSQDQEKCVFRR